MQGWELEVIELLRKIEANTRPKEKKPRQTEMLIDGGAQKLMQIWNEWKELKLPRVTGITPGSPRYKNALSRWREKPNEQYWIQVVKRINDSRFCNGQNERGWVADFEFLVRPETHYKVLEGKYDKCHTEKKPEFVERTYYLPDGTPVVSKEKV